MKKYLLLLMIFICSFSFSAEPVDFKAKLVKGEVFPEFVLEKLSGTKELSTEDFDKNKKRIYIPPMTHPWKASSFKKQLEKAHTNHVYA